MKTTSKIGISLDKVTANFNTFIELKGIEEKTPMGLLRFTLKLLEFIVVADKLNDKQFKVVGQVGFELSPFINITLAMSRYNKMFVVSRETKI